jgi:hypothetical protein
VQALLAQAVRDTNTVHTLIYTSTSTQTTANTRVIITSRGEEDEVQNRERDQESVTAEMRQSNGQTKKIHYTADIIFLAGHTYYRTSLQSNTWHSRSGMRICDQVIGTCWQRTRTTIKLSGATLHQVATSSTHLQGPVKVKGGTGTVDVWLSDGSKPYVTRVVQTGTATVQGQKVESSVTTNYGPFNQSLTIAKPAGVK